MEIERNFLHVLMWYSYEKFQGKNMVLSPMLSREAIILQNLIIQFVLYYMYLSEESSANLQTVSYENRHNIR